ncbi:hypothetical protein [Catelliglobosispora koreensis]|uniref:hypothetical protein n=1 Tax=Catelliglobosispora koreensis TaxID=129052 RepID=UPI00035CA56E|nr:hypothetical protein [Catelliglobosispora koreensis]
MNRSVKRLLALAGSATVGVFAAVAIATPAHAHHTNASGSAVCQADGTFKITWSVEHPGNWQGRTAKIETLTVSPNGTITPVAPAATFAVGTTIAPLTTLKGTQTVPGGTTSATLVVKARWFNTNGSSTDITDVETVTLDKDNGLDGKCVKDSLPTASFVSLCDGTVKVHIVNGSRLEQTFSVEAGEWFQTKKLAAGAEGDVVVPADKAKTTIVVKLNGGKINYSLGWTRPENCPTPKAEGDSDCTTFKVTVTNPQDGLKTTATITYGTQTKTVDLAPGESKVVDLAAGNTGEATVTFSGWGSTQTVKYEKPADCAGLPVTGPNTVTYIGTGIGVAILGFFAVYFGRRRLARLRRLAA